MFDDDALVFGNTLAGLDPVRARRPDGDIYRSAVLGELRFARMPHGRPCFWQGEQKTPDSREPFEVICDTEQDELPSVVHEACVTAIRRTQLEYARVVTPSINAELRRHRSPFSVSWEQLRLCMVHLPYQPFAKPRWELAFVAQQFRFDVICVGGQPTRVMIDTNS